MSNATRTRKRTKQRAWDWQDVPQPLNPAYAPEADDSDGASPDEVLAALHTRMRDLTALRNRVDRELEDVQHQIDAHGAGGPVWLHKMSPGHKVTRQIAADVRTDRAAGMTYDAISAKHGISRSYAHALVKGRKSDPMAYLKHRKDGPT